MLHKTKATYVHPSGNPLTAKYIIVGTQPDKLDIIKGKPFSGYDGTELTEDLHKAGISRSDCYMTYVIKDADRPLAFYIKPQFRNKTITGYTITEEGQKYVNLLATELTKCTSSNVIIALGDVPLFILGDRQGIMKWRGSVIRPTLMDGKNLIGAVDPKTITGEWGNYGNFKNRRLLIIDLIRAKKVALGEWNCIPRSITIRPSFNQCLLFLRACEQYGLLGNIIFYDIEVDMFNGEMTCISLAFTSSDVISIPFTHEHGDYFTLPQEIEILQFIARILENPDIEIGGQNLSFDSNYLMRKYGICVTSMHDTMVAQKTLLPDYPVGLHFICSTYTDIPYYKDDGKYWIKGQVGTYEMFWKYNAMDSVVCADAFPKQLEALKKQGNYSTYLRKVRSIPAYVYIMEHGIKINLDTMVATYDKLNRNAEAVLAELTAMAGTLLNPNSPKQIASYFYDTKRLPAYKSKSGGRSTDEKALKRISRKGYKEAKLILKYRHLVKTASTFLNPAKVDTDGRMRCSYNPVGTRYARASSSENIFGTGNNLQNQPHEVLTHFEADENYVFYGLDLSQAENRIVAMVGRISQMIECFETKKDVHSLVATIMANLYYGGKLPMGFDPKKTLAPIGDGTKCWRDWGKKTGHAANYNITYKTLSLYNEIPERDGKTILEIYHKAFPGVRGGYHAYIQQCINKNRTLRNLMGRITLFTDKLDDSLYTEAYACIPQGTVGDIIDERGLNFIYYNTNPLFKFVELLIQVHDQIGFQIPTPYHPTRPVPWEDHNTILQLVKGSLETPLYTHYKYKFVIPVDITMGISLNKDLGRDLKNFDHRTLESCYEDLFYTKMENSHYLIEEAKG